jgi:hypothetical protein
MQIFSRDAVRLLTDEEITHVGGGTIEDDIPTVQGGGLPNPNKLPQPIFGNNPTPAPLPIYTNLP